MQIACACAGKSKERFLRDLRLFATDGSCERAADDAVARRVRGEPLAYILGEWEFYGLPMSVSGEVLIPRADTEVLAREGIRIAEQAGQGARVLDLCAGSGCVGLAITANVKTCRVTLVDNSPGALKLCKENMSRNGLMRGVVCVDADVRQNPPVMLGQYNLIVCNPPYIPSGEIDKLDYCVRAFEPRAALDGGQDGLDFFRAITDTWTPLLREGGSMAFECGAGQSGSVAEIMAPRGFTDIRALADTAGIERVVVGQLLL
jgi:release factor glutamine methyltransferase